MINSIMHIVLLREAVDLVILACLNFREFFILKFLRLLDLVALL